MNNKKISGSTVIPYVVYERMNSNIDPDLRFAYI